ncbi:MAG: hypothetical protein JWN68_1189 [Nocardioides sp.]|uniref:hypothetical protein n=1 Tax=Nocardioides sp. TaxID=35761 RepID=UPI0026064AF7|nr:hypothetical protein [Nocardioides sp.]MCW2833236.1 hypothetical protein [Nocardioides sp.]
MLVPLLVSLSLAEARSRVADSGLRLRAQEVLGTACLPLGDVLRQRPAPDRMVALRSRVTVQVNSGAPGECGLDLPAPPPQLDQVARAFERFARGAMQDPPADTPVTLYLGGVRTEVISRQGWQRPAEWRLCPAGGGYAGRTCSFSAVDLIRNHDGPLATTSAKPPHSCAHPQPLSATDAGGRYSVTLTPDESLDCTSYWAVQLIINDVYQLVAVNIVLAEP